MNGSSLMRFDCLLLLKRYDWVTECDDCVYAAVCAANVVGEEVKHEGGGLQRTINSGRTQQLSADLRR